MRTEQLATLGYASHVAHHVTNGSGESIEDPTLHELRAFLEELDDHDEEHGAAWLVKDGVSIQWVVDGRVTNTDLGQRSVRHLKGVSRARALELWKLLIAGEHVALEQQPWQPGNGFVLNAERAAQRVEWQRSIDREFYDVLGAERSDVRCHEPGCKRGAISLSVLCRPHHFEMVKKRPCPFDD